MDELGLRQMPHSAEAEQSVIGSILLDPRCIGDVVELLRPEDFFFRHNQDVYETVYTMFGLSQPIDIVTVMEEMRRRGVFDEQTTRPYLAQLLEQTPTAAHVREYCAIVRDRAVLRLLAETGGQIASEAVIGAGQSESLMELAEQKVFAIREGKQSQDMATIGTVLVEVYDRLSELAKNAGQLPGLPTGLREVDEFISGLNRSDLVLIASRPGMGKTSMALNIAMHAAKKSGKAVAIFSLEMSREQLGMRMVSSEALVDSRKLMTGQLGPEDWKRIAHATSTLSPLDIRIDDNPALGVSEMKAKCRRIKNLGIIIIDYLQLMQGSGRSDNRVQEVGEISRSLKIMAKELDVPVLCLSQLSRASETRPNKRPVLSDLRESGAIEQDADVVMFLYREEYYNEETDKKNLAECIIAKNRHGPTGHVELQWIAQYTSFSSPERRYDALP